MPPGERGAQHRATPRRRQWGSSRWAGEHAGPLRERFAQSCSWSRTAGACALSSSVDSAGSTGDEFPMVRGGAREVCRACSRAVGRTPGSARSVRAGVLGPLAERARTPRGECSDLSEGVLGPVGGSARTCRRECSDLSEGVLGPVGGSARTCRRECSDLSEGVLGPVGGSARTCRRECSDLSEGVLGPVGGSARISRAECSDLSEGVLGPVGGSARTCRRECSDIAGGVLVGSKGARSRGAGMIERALGAMAARTRRACSHRDRMGAFVDQPPVDERVFMNSRSAEKTVSSSG